MNITTEELRALMTEGEAPNTGTEAPSTTPITTANFSLASRSVFEHLLGCNGIGSSFGGGMDCGQGDGIGRGTGLGLGSWGRAEVKEYSEA